MKKLPPATFSSRGFTLIELIIVMAIFMIVIVITSQAFNKILNLSTQQTKSSVSDTQGVIGLEMLRLDLEHAGYGLPWVLNFPADFNESNAAVGHLAPGIDTESFNDTNNASGDTNKVPRAVQAGTAGGPDYLVIKSVLAGSSGTTKKWTYVEGNLLKAWGQGNDFVVGERVITIDSRTKRLIGSSVASADFSYAVPSTMIPPDGTGGGVNFQPQQDTDVYVVYGVSPSTNLRVPYNRVDYYVKRPTTPGSMTPRCAPNTGILYKAIMDHGTGAFSPESPLVECVADMQVVFSLDTNGDGGVDLHVPENGLSAMTAKDIRSQLKEIRVYVLAHEGGKDTSYNHSTSSIYVGEFGSGRTVDLNALVGADYKYYRWKTYTIVVVPRNINY